MRAAIKAVGKSLLGRLARAAIRRRPRFTPAQWQLRRGGDGSLMVDGHSLPDLARRFGSPLHVLRADVLDAAAHGFRSHGCDPHASVKTHPSAPVLRRLQRLGLGAEAVSPHEYRLARFCGFAPARIVANQTLPDWPWFDTLAGEGAALINLNGGTEIAPAADRARALGLTPRVGLRVAIGDWSERFGEPVHSAVEAVGALLRQPALQWRGLHVHVGGLLRSPAEVQALADSVAAFCGTLWQAHRQLPPVLDLGGALACPTMDWVSARDRKLNSALAVPLPPPDAAQVPSPERYCGILRRTLDAAYAACSQPPPQILLEPGRALYARAQLTLLTVRGAREARNHRLLLLDGGTNLLQIVASSYHEVFPAGPVAAGPEQLYKLCGPLAHAGDVLVDRIWLPPLAAGDVLAVMDTGAYCQAAASQFSWLRPAQVLLEGDTVQRLRRAETLDDFLACDVDASA